MLPWPALDDEIAAFCSTPKSVNVQNIRADPADRDFEKALPLGCLEELTLFLGQAVADPAATDFCPSRLAPAEPLDIVFVRSGHDQSFREN